MPDTVAPLPASVVREKCEEQTSRWRDRQDSLVSDYRKIAALRPPFADFYSDPTENAVEYHLWEFETRMIHGHIMECSQRSGRLTALQELAASVEDTGKVHISVEDHSLLTEEVRPWQERAESYPERLERKKRYWAEIAPRAIEPPAPPKRGFLNRLFNGAN